MHVLAEDDDRCRRDAEAAALGGGALEDLGGRQGRLLGERAGRAAERSPQSRGTRWGDATRRDPSRLARAGDLLSRFLRRRRPIPCLGSGHLNLFAPVMR